MKLIKTGAAVLNQTPRDWKGNLENILEAIRQAKEKNVTVLCLPEMAITGYGLEDDLFCTDVPRRAISKLAIIAPECKGMVVCIGLPVLFNNTLYNAVATVVDGAVVGFTCKQHLAGDGIHYEPRHFKPWPAGVVQTIHIPELASTKLSPSVHNNMYPIGDVHFNVGGVKIGYEICEDAWVANRPGTVLASKGVDIYLNPSASHFSFGKLNTRKNFVVDGSRAFGATYIYTNLVGNEAGRAIYDGGALIASGGTLLAVGKRFTYQNVLLTVAITDVDTTKTSQVRTASFQPDVNNYNKGCVEVFFNWPVVTETNLSWCEEEWESSANVKHEECVRALGLALMDYTRKSHTKGAVVSLSGGADSAACIYFYSMGIRFAIEELGVAHFISKYFPHLRNGTLCSMFDTWTTEEQIQQLIRLTITTAYQSTAQSSIVTREAAKKVAEAIGTTHFEFDVDSMVKDYMKFGERLQGSPLTFEKNDLPLQNLQARVRAPGIWLLANMEEKLLLTTSNMSEAAVGYATMDGDTAGSVAPIAGLPKVYIREFLRWVEAVSVPAMKYINKQQPTAELRPASANQTDESDLMPYGLLHRIETLVVKNRYTPIEIYKTITVEGGYENNQLIGWIKKFFRLFSVNQWKRERYALSFHMDDHNLDPRTWCRTPILTGGYEEELTELDAYLNK